jgi:precorrin-6B methylase 2
VDAARFERELAALFDDFPRSEQPRDARFGEVLDRLGGLAKENNLALVNLAASLLGPDECYVEFGAFKGASLVSAMLGNEEKQFVAIDSFSLAGGSRALLEANLRSFGLEPPEILEGDVFELIDGGALDGRKLGAC